MSLGSFRVSSYLISNTTANFLPINTLKLSDASRRTTSPCSYRIILRKQLKDIKIILTLSYLRT